MAKYFQLIVIAVAAYLAWAYGMPWVKRFVGRSQAPISDPAPGPGGNCVQMAAQASQKLGDEALTASRGLLDEGEWRRIVDAVDSSLFFADDACRCELESCQEGRSAVSDLRRILEQLEASSPTGSQSAPYELSRDHERINQRLWDARALALDGH